MSDAREMRAWLRDTVYERGFLDRYPGYAALLASLEVVDDASVPVMAVSQVGEGFRLHVNREFFAARPEHAAGVLLHEIHHIAHGHVTDPTLGEAVHRDLMTTAMEIAANDLVREELPGSPVRGEAYASFGVRPGQSTAEIYRHLVAARKRGDDPPTASPSSCGGALAAGRRPGMTLPGGDLLSSELLEQAMASMRHRDVMRRSAMEAHLELKRMIDSSVGFAGRRGPTLSRLLEGAAEAPAAAMDWRTALRLLLARTRPRRYTHAYPSRRAPHRLGEIPGRRRMTSRSGRLSVLAAIDTSASMSAQVLSEIARQMAVLDRLATVTVVECDHDIKRVYRFRHRLEEVSGGGGTDYRPVFESRFLRRHRPDAVVYFTDGRCRDYPDSSPPVSTLWVLTGPVDFTCPWGHKARLFVNDDGPARSGEPAVHPAPDLPRPRPSESRRAAEHPRRSVRRPRPGRTNAVERRRHRRR